MTRRIVDADTFGRAVIMFNKGKTWDEVAAGLPPYTGEELKNSYDELRHMVLNMNLYPLGEKYKDYYDQHRDTGCYKSPRCLECPLPKCIFENEKVKKHKWTKEEDQYIREHYGMLSCKVIGNHLDISERTVQQRITTLKLSNLKKLNFKEAKHTS